MKRRHLAMGAALAVAAALAIFGDKSADVEVAEPVRTAAAPARVAPKASERSASTSAANAAILRLVPRAELIGATGEGAFQEAGGVFQGQNWNPPPPMAAAEAAGPPSPPPAPTAPPLPFTVLGKGLADGAWEVYLARPDRTYVARVGTVIDGMYRIDAIAPPTMTITYLPLNQVQQLNIGVMD
jgi:hypothetical protein